MATYFRVNLESALEYRVSFIIQALGMALSNASFVFFWWVAVGQAGGTVGGYEYLDILFIWAVTAAGFGLGHIFFANMRQITRLIVTGELDTFLLQPRDVLLNVLCARTDMTAWGDFVYGVIMIGITRGLDARAWGAFALGSVSGMMIVTALNVTVQSLAFWAGEITALSNIASELALNFSLYPEGIYPGVIKLIMYTAIPVAFVSHVPLKLALGGAIWWAALSIGVALVYTVIAWVFFTRGLRKYESGNLIVTRM